MVQKPENGPRRPKSPTLEVIMHNLRKLVIHNYLLNIKKIKKHWYELQNLPLMFTTLYL